MQPNPPQQTLQTQPAAPFWKTTAGVVVGVVGGVALLGVMCIGGCTALVGVGAARQAAQPKPQADVTLCDIDTTNPYLKSAKVGFRITNRTDRAQSYMLKLEVQDAAGVRVGDSVALVSQLAPGRAESGERIVFLSGTGATRCLITEVT